MRSGVSCVMAVSLVGPPGALSIIHSQAATAARMPPSHLKFPSHPKPKAKGRGHTTKTDIFSEKLQFVIIL